LGREAAVAGADEPTTGYLCRWLVPGLSGLSKILLKKSLAPMVLV